MKKNLVLKNEVISNKKLKNLFLDYYNNYLTVKTFANDYNLTEMQAIAIINEGRKIHEKESCFRKH